LNACPCGSGGRLHWVCRRLYGFAVVSQRICMFLVHFPGVVIVIVIVIVAVAV